MKRVLFAAAGLFAFGGTAQAADLFSALYGNTLNETVSSGSKAAIYINQDMTWERHLANGIVIKGTYAWKDAATACFTQTDPAPSAADQATRCIPEQTAHAVGDTWTVPGADGKPATLNLSAGR